MKRRRISQREFEQVMKRFESRESSRGPLYKMALDLRHADFEVAADLLILATWNFAGFRFVMRTFTIQHFRDAITTTTPHFERLADYSFPSVDFDSISADVTAIYDAFKSVAKQTGASKIIHLRQPKLFVMWDTDIRRNFEFAQHRTSARDYIDFHKRMQDEFGHLRWNRDDKTFAKAIDEYNYLVAHPNA
jgi:hypothetical protein